MRVAGIQSWGTSVVKQQDKSLNQGLGTSYQPLPTLSSLVFPWASPNFFKWLFSPPNVKEMQTGSTKK